MKRLFIFTSAFPFGRKESFLGEEIIFHAARFDKIIIIPLNSSGVMRPIPDNCTVDSSLNCSKITKIICCLFGLFYVLPTFLKFLPRFGSIHYCKKIKKWFKFLLLASFYRQSSIVKYIEKNGTLSDVVYSYWGVEYNSVFPFIDSKVHLISRFHGDWDLWEDKYYDYVPLRPLIVKVLDTAVFIANKGEEYFKKKYPICNTRFFPLGSKDNGLGKSSNDNILRIISCSRVYPLKRVPLIFEALQSIKEKKIEWYHIGDGPTFDDLQKTVACNINENLKISLLGYKDHCDVMDFYNKYPIDVFINLSTNEGVPVSIMEAISFDIPVIATDVGCTSEVVTKETGILLNPNPSLEEIKKAILSISKMQFTPRKYWETHYNAEINYSAFSDYLLSLVQDC